MIKHQLMYLCRTCGVNSISNEIIEIVAQHTNIHIYTVHAFVYTVLKKYI